MSTWRAVKSNKPRRDGEAFVLRDNDFVLKVYRDVVPDSLAFAQRLAKALQRAEDEGRLTTLS